MPVGLRPVTGHVGSGNYRAVLSKPVLNSTTVTTNTELANITYRIASNYHLLWNANNEQSLKNVTQDNDMVMVQEKAVCIKYILNMYNTLRIMQREVKNITIHSVPL